MTFLRRLPVGLKFALSLIFGGAAALGLAPVGLWYATLAALFAVVVLFLASRSHRQAFWCGWAFGTGYFAIGLVWIVEPFLVDPERHGWMAPFALVLLSGGLAILWGGAFAMAWRLARRRARNRALALVVCLSLIELLRAYIFTGFPWAGFAQIWVDTGARALLPWIGPHGLAILTLGAVAWPALSLLRRYRLSMTSLSILPLAALVWVALSPDFNADAPAPTDKIVRLIQPNAPQDQKWDPAHMPFYYQRQIAFTAANGSPDLIVWPETAVPAMLDRSDDIRLDITQAARGVPVVLGIRRSEGLRLYNSMVVIGKDGDVQALYDKHHLVPFGEYIPFGDYAAKMGIHGLAAGEGAGFSAGPGPQALEIDGVGAALALICYEAVFPGNIRFAGPRPDLMVQITNDAWFGNHSGPYQHLAQAQMRAAETGLPMVRVANTGVSAVIDARGNIIDQIALNKSGYLDVPIPSAAPATVYWRLGDLPAALVLIAAWLALIAGKIARLRRK